MTAALRKIAKVDRALLVSWLLLTGFGLVMVYSASSVLAADRYGDGAFFLKRQLISLLVGGAGMLFVFFLRIRLFRSFAWPVLGVCFCMLAITIFSSFGVEANRATRWIQIGGFNFQPAEFAKLAFVLFLATYLAKRREKIQEFWRGLCPVLSVSLAFLVLLLAQPDFGTSVLLASMVALMLFIGRARLVHLGFLFLFGLGATSYLVYSAPYRFRRVLSFLDPWADPQGMGFQIIQSFVAFERGSWAGQGLGDGSQKLLYLPEAHTDFIFSVIAEELGLIGSLSVLLLMAILVFQGFRLALRLREPFAAYLAFGISALFALQTAFNVGVVTGVLPTKGMTFPFLSYGGSSLIVSMMMIGILLSLSATATLKGNMARRRAI